MSQGIAEPPPEADELPLIRFAAVCTRCKQPFSGCAVPDPFEPTRLLLTKRVCDPCVNTIRAAQAEKERAIRDVSSPAAVKAAAWALICPKSYRTTNEGGSTDLGRLHAEQPLMSLADGPDAYRFSATGLLFRGDSGTCKSRVMWRVLRRQWDAGMSVLPFTAGEFEREFRDAAGNHRLMAWFDRVFAADCFFIDDLGKSKWSQNTVETFFDLVEKRTNSDKPCFITTNYARDTLAANMELAKDEAEPLLRRLLENCDCRLFRSNTR